MALFNNITKVIVNTTVDLITNSTSEMFHLNTTAEEPVIIAPHIDNVVTNSTDICDPH